jgi:hypothetical protein
MSLSKKNAINGVINNGDHRKIGGGENNVKRVIVRRKNIGNG